MPREIVHWKVLQEACKAAREAKLERVARILETRLPESYLGAIGHDVPFYYRFGTDPFISVAWRLHGKLGEDTLDPLRWLGEQIEGTANLNNCQGCWAFLMGMITHYAADVAFHPLVFFFTGRYSDPDPLKRRLAQGRHRLFEVYLDSWFRPRTLAPFNHSISKTLGALNRQSKADIFALLEDVLIPEKCSPEIKQVDIKEAILQTRWSHGFQQMATLQKLFFSNFVGGILRLAHHLSNDRLIGYDGLSSFGRWKPEKIFDKTISFLNPVSGEEMEKHVEDLLEEAVSISLELFESIEITLQDGSPSNSPLFSGRYGKSLNFGLEKTTGEQAVYFSEAGFPLKGLTHSKL